MSAPNPLIRFTDEQSMLLDTAVSFCREKSPIRAVRDRLTTELGFERALWDEMVALGWSGIAVPEQLGGSGLSLAEVATIAEPMGRHLLATPFASTQLCIQALLACADDALQAQWLPRLCQGAVGTVALLEPEGDWDLSHVEAGVRRDGDSVHLSGVKTLVCDAAVADVLLVSVNLAGAPALVVLPAADLPAQALQKEIVIDETARCARLTLDGLRVPASAVITGAAARASLQAVRNAGLLLASAQAAGGIAGVLDVVVEYLNTRTTFGRKIGSYQSLKHTCADILVGMERARSHVYHAATLLADGQDALNALRMAKVEAGDTFAFAGDRAVQFHGGFGFTFECDAQLFLRRALWLQYSFGDAAHHRRRLADSLLGEVSAR
jgi:acyl-CoA dehydrogenase